MVAIFSLKRFIVDVWQGPEYASYFEYANVLNIRGFWIYQAFEYARVLNIYFLFWIVI